MKRVLRTAGIAAAVGLVAGLGFGWAQSIALGLPYRSEIGVWRWAEVLAYSGLAHGVLWAANGALFGLLLALASVLFRRMPRPGPLGLGIFAASSTAFMVWTVAAFYGMPGAQGIRAPWVAAIAGYWILCFLAVYGVARSLADTRLGAWGSRALRWGAASAASILIVAAGIQWWERPRADSDWRWEVPAVDTGAARQQQPNVVWIVIDTQRVDRFGSYGYRRPTTPRIDAFAADALVFENCTSAAIWTLPSHASMFTGLFPSEHTTDHNHHWLDGEFVTVAELLRDAGYETIAFSNNSWVAPLTNVTQGFERVFRPGVIHHPRGNSLFEFMDRVLYPAGVVRSWLGAPTSQDAGAKYTAETVRRWLDRRDAARPFFLFVNVSEPHMPLYPHLPQRKLFVAPDALERSYGTFWAKGADDFSLTKRPIYSAEELVIMNDLYDAETRIVDHYIGEILSSLARAVPLDDTLVILTADHGENLGDHHLLGHAHMVNETLVHVPLVVRYPKRFAPGRTSTLVQTIDLAPTILDVAGVAPPEPISTFGRSLLAPENPERLVVAERMAANPTLGIDLDLRVDTTPFKTVIRSARRGPWKYVAFDDGRELLYDLQRDPGEAQNVVEQHRDVRNSLASALGDWLSQRRPPPEPNTAFEGSHKIEADTEAQLRALGYIK